MALQSSGNPISLGDIRTELKVSNSPFSIRQAELGNYDTININSASKPDGNSPHSFSEWYEYNHNPIVIEPDTWTDFISLQRQSLAANQCATGPEGNYYQHNGDSAYPNVGDYIRLKSDGSDLPGISYIRFSLNFTDTFGNTLGVATDFDSKVIARYTC